MEHLNWKDAEIKSKFGHCKSLGELVREIEDKHTEQGHVICKIRVNGMALNELDEERFSLSKIEEIESLDIEYSSIHALVYDTELSTMNYAKSLVAVVCQVAEQFRSDNLQLAHASFKSLAESLDALMQANQLSINVRNLEKLSVSSALEDLDKKFLLLLSEILNSYEKRDFILIADVLEYDLTQCLIDLAKALEETIDRHNRPDRLDGSEGLASAVKANTLDR